MTEVCIITNHKSLVAILSINVASLSWHLQCILLQMHHFRVYITYKPGPVLYTVDWLSYNNQKENKDHEIEGMRVNMNTISTSLNITVHTSMQDIQTAIHEECHLQE